MMAYRSGRECLNDLCFVSISLDEPSVQTTDLIHLPIGHALMYRPQSQQPLPLNVFRVSSWSQAPLLRTKFRPLQNIQHSFVLSIYEAIQYLSHLADDFSVREHLIATTSLTVAVGFIDVIKNGLVIFKNSHEFKMLSDIISFNVMSGHIFKYLANDMFISFSEFLFFWFCFLCTNFTIFVARLSI